MTVLDPIFARLTISNSDDSVVIPRRTWVANGSTLAKPKKPRQLILGEDNEGFGVNCPESPAHPQHHL
jgi:hypothetical protein